MDFEPILIAAIRFVVVIIGGLSIYLGYRLFLAVRTIGDGHAVVKLPGDVTVMLSRIGPGVFFALFGALIVGTSLALPIQFSTLTTQATPMGLRQEVRNVSGVGERSGPISLHQSDASETERLTIREQLRFLNQVPNLLDATLSEDRRRRVQQGVRDAKLHLMKSVWGDGWGQYDQFAAWAEGRTQPSDSKTFLAAREYFETGKE